MIIYFKMFLQWLRIKRLAKPVKLTRKSVPEFYRAWKRDYLKYRENRWDI